MGCKSLRTLALSLGIPEGEDKSIIFFYDKGSNLHFKDASPQGHAYAQFAPPQSLIGVNP